MKNKIFILPLMFIATLLAVSSCDYVDEPYVDGDIVVPVSDTTRIILIEDFTGHKCKFCPGGHKTLEDLKKIYGKQLVSMAIHTGWYANVDASGPYTYDFTTTFGDDLKTQFSLDFVGFPIGMVNRIPKEGSSNVLSLPEDWGSQMATLLTNPEPDAYIHLDVQFNDADSTINVDTETTFFTPNSTSTKYNMVVCITEDSIIKPQDDNGTTITDYVHNHVLRGGITTTLGEEIFEGTVDKGDIKTKSFSYNQFGSDWVPDQCHIVAYLMYANGANEGQVIQAQEVHLK